MVGNELRRKDAHRLAISQHLDRVERGRVGGGKIQPSMIRGHLARRGTLRQEAHHQPEPKNEGSNNTPAFCRM